MRSLLKVVLIAGLLVGVSRVSVGQSPAAAAGADTAALGLARRLLIVMHAQDALFAGMDSAMAAERRAGNTKVPPVFYDSLMARLHRVAPQLIDSLAAVYASHLSPADLKAVVQFYESPLGQRYATAQMEVELQSSAIAKRWGMRLALDVMKDLVDKGLITDIPH